MTHLCTFRTVPEAGNECRDAMWSEGKACKQCLVTCYRRGWDRGQVLVDNMRMVGEKRVEMENEK